MPNWRSRATLQRKRDFNISFSLYVFVTEQTGHVLAWKHGIAVLTAGDVKVTSNPRIRLMPPQQGIIDTSVARSTHSNSYNLEIQNVRMTDAGDYACQIGSIVPKEIVHSLEVLGKFTLCLDTFFFHFGKTGILSAFTFLWALHIPS